MWRVIPNTDRIDAKCLKQRNVLAELLFGHRRNEGWMTLDVFHGIEKHGGVVQKDLSVVDPLLHGEGAYSDV